MVTDVQALERKAVAFQLDTRDVPSFDNFIQQTTEYLRKKTGSPNFDFLINNAGTALYVPATQVTEEQMNNIYYIRYKGVFFLTQKALPFINDGGIIINILSGLTRIIMPGCSIYGSLKAAIETLTRYPGERTRSEKNTGQRGGTGGC